MNFRMAYYKSMAPTSVCIMSKLHPLHKRPKMAAKILSLLLLAILSVVSSTQYPDYSGDSPDEPSFTDTPDEPGKVNIITLDSEKLEAIYYTSQESGIHILSEVRGEEEYLKVRTLEGEIFIEVDRPNQLATSLTIMGYQFLITNNTISETERYLTGYAVPNTFTKATTNALKKKQIKMKLIRHLDLEGANSSRDDAMEELLMRAEVVMFEEAAKALGDKGIIGSECPPAMSFYVLAMRLMKFRNQALGINSDEEDEMVPREKRRHCRWPLYHCRHGYCCRRCPYRYRCRGMCGLGCSCWRWVCGDCCYHQGCYEHDICCINRYSWGCLAVHRLSCHRHGVRCY